MVQKAKDFNYLRYRFTVFLIILMTIINFISHVQNCYSISGGISIKNIDLNKENAIFKSKSHISNLKQVNINTASINELMSLPSIGKTLAKRIIVYRNVNKKFKSISEILKIKGIGKKKFSKIKKFIKITD